MFGGMRATYPLMATSDQCIWNCGRPANSDEDVLPTWIRNQIGAKAGRKRWLLKDLTPPGRPTPSANPRERELRGFSVVARKIVCVQCNNGWMSELQGMTKPVLSRMFNGEEAELGPTDQHRLLRWSTMTAICNQYSFGETLTRLEGSTCFIGHRQLPTPKCSSLTCPSPPWIRCTPRHGGGTSTTTLRCMRTSTCSRNSSLP